MPNAPVTIYNRDRERVAYCEQAFDIGYRLQKDALWRAWFSLPLDDPKNDEISDLYYAEIYDGDTRIELFRVISTSKHRRDGKPIITYHCEHALGTLMDEMLIGVFNAGPGTTAAINTVLAEQTTENWVLNTQDFARNFYHDWEDVTLLKALFSIPTRFTNDHVWTWDTTCYPWRLNLETASATVSAKIRYQRELKDIQKDSDARYLYTRLYAFGFGAGADQLDILTVDQMVEGRPEFTSGSTEFTVGETLTGATSGETCVVASFLLESGTWGGGDAQGPLFVTGMSGVFTDGEDLNGSAAGANCATLDKSLDHVNAASIVTYGIISRNWVDQRYTDADNLQEQAQARVDKNSVPRATYRLSAMDFNRLAGTNHYVLGDLVRIYDSELGIDVNVLVTLISKGDVEGRPGDVTLQLATEEEKFVNFGDIVYADDLDGVKSGTFGKVLSTSISAGVILLSQIAGGQLGAIPTPPTIGGLYLGSDHMGYHDGTNWITYTDNTGVAQWNGIGADNAHIQWDPAGGGTLDIKSANVDISGTMTITAGVVGGFNVDPTEGLYIGAGATRVQMKPGAGIWCGATAIGDAPFSVTDDGTLVATSATITGGITATTGSIGGWTIGATTLTGGNLTLDAGNTKITAGTGQDIIIIDAAHATYRLFIGETDPTMAPFSVTKAGVMVATSATITGTVTATAGTVGGFTISVAEGLYAGAAGTRVQMKPGVGFWAGATAFADAPFKASQAGQVVCSNIQITGAGSTWGGATLATAKIPNLDCDKITSGTFGVVRIPNLDADKITTGSLTVARTDADVTADNVAASISGQGDLATRDTVNQTYIDENSVRTSELYLDGDLQFKPGVTHNGLMGVDGIWYSRSKGTTQPFITFSSTQITVHSGSTSGNDLNIIATDDLTIQANSGPLKLETIGATADIYLKAQDEIWFQVEGTGTTAKLQAIAATDSVTLKVGHEGLMTFDVGGVTRYVAFREEA